MVQTTHRIKDNRIEETLNKLHKKASSEMFTVIKGASKSIFRKLEPADMKDAYIAITRDQGEFIYNLLLEKQARNIIEFGTSFGISTIYLAAAAKQTNGHVITSELLANKCQIAQQNFDAAGLSKWIDLREGDALETLKEIPEGIDFLLLDGWNELYLPLVKMLAPKLKKGALIYTDNAGFPSTKPFLDFLQSNPTKYRNRKVYESKGGALLTEIIS